MSRDIEGVESVRKRGKERVELVIRKGRKKKNDGKKEIEATREMGGEEGKRNHKR